MKRIFFATLCMLLAIGVSAANQKEDKRVRVAAVANTGDRPALDGIAILKKFQNGDETWDVTKDSSRRMRKKATQMAYELYRKGKLSYQDYAVVAGELGFRPRKM